MVYWNDVMRLTLDSGGSLVEAKQAVVAGFTESAEWQDRIGALDDAAFVDLLYTNIFGRNAEPAGHAFHLANLQTGAATREDLIRQFIESPEVLWRFERHTYVTMAYVGCLRRAPERAGFVHHMNRISEKATPSKHEGATKSSFDIVGLVRGIIYSPEYIDRLAALGCTFPHEPPAITVALPGGVPLEMVRIPAGAKQALKGIPKGRWSGNAAADG